MKPYWQKSGIRDKEVMIGDRIPLASFAFPNGVII